MRKGKTSGADAVISAVCRPQQYHTVRRAVLAFHHIGDCIDIRRVIHLAVHAPMQGIPLNRKCVLDFLLGDRLIKGKQNIRRLVTVCRDGDFRLVGRVRHKRNRCKSVLTLYHRRYALIFPIPVAELFGEIDF